MEQIKICGPDLIHFEPQVVLQVLTCAIVVLSPGSGCGVIIVVSLLVDMAAVIVVASSSSWCGCRHHRGFRPRSCASVAASLPSFHSKIAFSHSTAKSFGKSSHFKPRLHSHSSFLLHPFVRTSVWFLPSRPQVLLHKISYAPSSKC